MTLNPLLVEGRQQPRVGQLKVGAWVKFVSALTNKAVVGGSLSVFGTFTVENNDINLKVEGGSWAAWNGTVQKRLILSLTADELRYTVRGSVGGSNVNVLKRIN